MVKILTSLRNLKILSKKNMDPLVKVEIYNSEKNAIDLDSPVEDKSDKFNQNSDFLKDMGSKS